MKLTARLSKCVAKVVLYMQMFSSSIGFGLHWPFYLSRECTFRRGMSRANKFPSGLPCQQYGGTIKASSQEFPTPTWGVASEKKLIWSQSSPTLTGNEFYQSTPFRRNATFSANDLIITIRPKLTVIIEAIKTFTFPARAQHNAKLIFAPFWNPHLSRLFFSYVKN